jgi:hypothetical protein
MVDVQDFLLITSPSQGDWLSVESIEEGWIRALLNKAG